ncbi:hypothetical protein EXU30_02295 [Shewanella maritima]|uniref:Uncharacterized protein n=1 Tax=Shewanella maritima TaxID=2520507 RepID=A0A411PDP6_9GAMM|nr:hypothetical protein [Shewanella maritima]QBF81651.1 hypothetical protein EXU30_02295 [Shewanella maritima]
MKSYIGGKYIPLKLVLFPALAMFGVLLFPIMPITLYLKDVPFQNWPSAFLMLSLIGVAMTSIFSFMAWIFCELCASKLSRITSAICFGIISPLVLIGTLTLVAMVKGNNFLEDINTPQGLENVLILSVSSFIISVVIFWQSTKNT